MTDVDVMKLPDRAAASLPAGSAGRPVWHLALSYDGAAYSGWQVQPHAPTIHGELEKRLRLLFRAPALRLAATSRTDAGVHALDQHVTFSLPPELEVLPELTPEQVRYVLNRWLPAAIRVQAAELREPAFHARHSAIGKAYTYVISNQDQTSPFAARYAWIYPNRVLDTAAMAEAASAFVGEHDFASFAANDKHGAREDTVRRLWKVEVIRDGSWVYLNVLGESFLYKMVRAIAGFLLHVGRGSCPPHAVHEVLAARNRGAAADSAPAQGLFLARVFWQPDEGRRYTPQLPPFVP